MSATQSKKSVALIGNQMNVSKEWLDQVKILETGTTEQKIALAGSDKVLDSIQIALACDEVLEVRLALSENPKLIENAKRILGGSCFIGEDKITNEEMVRIAYAQDDKFVRREYIAKNGDIPESVKLDIIDWECDVKMIVKNLLCTENFKKMSKAVQLRLIRLMSLSEQQAKGIKSQDEYGCTYYEYYYASNHWNFATQLARGFKEANFENVDKETQIAFAKALVQLYQDIKHSDECKNDKYVYNKETFTLSERASNTAWSLRNHPSFDVTAKVILSQIN